MIVRNEQIAAFAPSAEAAYAKSAADHLARFDPVLAAAAGPEGLQQAAKQGLEAARSHDLATGPALQLYLELMASLGSGFDGDPQYAWLRPFIDRREDMDNVERARYLHFHTNAYVIRAYGTNKEFARAAVQRAHEQLARFTGPSASVEIQPIELLKWLHPQRLDFVDSEAAAELFAAARKTAGEAGLPAPQGANLLTILMFLFGRDMATDPLYPWVKKALQGSKPGPERLKGLVEEARTHFAAILSGMREEESQ